VLNQFAEAADHAKVLLLVGSAPGVNNRAILTVQKLGRLTSTVMVGWSKQVRLAGRSRNLRWVVGFGSLS